MGVWTKILTDPGLAARKAIDIGTHKLRRGIGHVRNLRFRLRDALTPVVRVPLANGMIAKFRAQNARSGARGQNLLVKEPGTTEWVRSFEPDRIFWDIGANVGTYSVLAALERNTTVLAFEPMPSTYAVLSENIQLNGQSERSGAFCLAFSNTTSIGEMYVRSADAGYSGNTFGKAVDHLGQHFDSTRLAMIGMTIDDFIAYMGAPVPNYLKIDVDGHEPEILEGAYKTLRNPTLGSVLIEVEEFNTTSKDRVLALMGAAGFRILRTDVLIETQSERSTNYIFERVRGAPS